MRPEDQVDTGAGPLDCLRLAIAAFVHIAGRAPLGAHVEQVDEEVVGQRLGLVGEDAVFGIPGIGAEHTQAADKNRRLRPRQHQQLGPVHQCFFRFHELQLAADVVAEAVGTGFERREGVDVRLLLRRVHTSRSKGDLHVHAGILCGLLDGSGAAEDDQIGQRHLLAEVLLDRFELLQDCLELRRLIDLPVLLRAQANARAVRAAAFIGAAERRRRRPGSRHELRHRQTRRHDLRLQSGGVLVIDQRMIYRRDRVLPDQRLLRHERAEVACERAHITMRELEPRAGKRVRELIRILVEAPRDLLVDRVEPQRQVRRQHGRLMLLGLVEGIRDAGLRAFRLPLFGAGRALRQLPFVFEQVLEEEIAPLGRSLRPGDLRTAGDRIGAHARTVLAPPAQALILKRATFRLRSDQRRIARAVGLAEAVAAGNQRDGFLVVHRHPEERFANILRGSDRIRIAVRPFRIHIDQAHLHRTKRLCKLTLAAVALITQPRPLGTPVELLRLPNVRAAACKPKGFEAHRLEGDVACENS